MYLRDDSVLIIDMWTGTCTSDDSVLIIDMWTGM